jgi:hypothetical protein
MESHPGSYDYTYGGRRSHPYRHQPLVPPSNLHQFNNPRSENQTATDTMTKASTHSADDQAEDADASCPSDVASDAVSVTSRADELPSW